MAVVLYLHYGSDQRYTRQLIFSILTALRYRGGSQTSPRIVVMSSEPNPVPLLPVEFLSISREQFESWTGEGTFGHRAKPLALRHALLHYNEPVALVDTDTYFIADPALLFERVSTTTSVMHCHENITISADWQWEPLVSQIGDGISIGSLRVTPQSTMWNSGVVGLHPLHAGGVDEIVAVIDQLHALAAVFSIEQFATSLVLERYTELMPCTDVVEHYWTNSRTFSMLQVDRFLARYPLTDVDAAIAATADARPGIPPMSRWDTYVSRLLGKLRGWDGHYQHTYLLYRTALHYAGSDAEIATLWAQSALSFTRDIVKPVCSDQARLDATLLRVQRDMPQFAPGKLEQLGWMGAKARSEWLEFWAAPVGKSPRRPGD